MYRRFIEHQVHESLSDTRVVLICGPRQSGKTTLATQIADADRPFITLDDATAFDAAVADPVGFIRGFERVAIDEIQRAPSLLQAIKASVDRDPRPGRFLLTGSANLMTLPLVADSLAGRMSIIRLFPLSQAEIRGNRPTLLERAFAGEPPDAASAAADVDLLEAVLAGGYPEALARNAWRRRRNWHLDYIEAIIQRDVQDIAQVDQLAAMPHLLRAFAEHSGQLANYSGIGARVGMNHVTTRKYLGIFENLFLVQSLPPWHTHALKRIAKSPKLHFIDSGLLAALRGLSPDRLQRERTPFGALLETFVYAELRKLASWSDERYALSHFRDKSGNEVDIVLEDGSGRIVGIETKAAATVSSRDFSGLHRLAASCGERFALGMVLYDHDRVVPFGEKLFAAPISALW